MKTHTKPTLLLLIGLLSVASYLNGQDTHSSQPQLDALSLSPALTGGFNGTVRAQMKWREQWNRIASYHTLFGSVDFNFCAEKFDTINRGWPQGLSVGVRLFRDVAGGARLTRAQTAFSLAYLWPLGREYFLSAGAMAGNGQMSFDLGHVIDEGLDERKLSDYQTFLDLAAGINLRYQSSEESRTYFDIGAGLYHLNKPTVSFAFAGESRVPRRLSAYGMGVLRMSHKWDLVAHAFTQFQDTNREVLLGVGARFHPQIDQLPAGLVLEATVGRRLGDAMVFTGRILYGMWQLGISVDRTTSSLRDAAINPGSLEISLGYVLALPSPQKVCPPIIP